MIPQHQDPVFLRRALDALEKATEPSRWLDKIIWAVAGMEFRTEPTSKQGGASVLLAFWPGEKEPTIDTWNSPSRQVDAILHIVSRVMPGMVPIMLDRRAILLQPSSRLSGNELMNLLLDKPECATMALSLAHALVEELLARSMVQDAARDVA